MEGELDKILTHICVFVKDIVKLELRSGIRSRIRLLLCPKFFV